MKMDMVYLQCDCRFNQWLLKKIDGKSVVEHTIERAKKCLKGKRTVLIAGVFECQKNIELVDILIKNGVDVKLTSENDVNKRFLDIICEEENGYVVRVGGDQCLLDHDNTNDIIINMRENSDEWFYDPACSCVFPDVVDIALIKKYRTELINGNRYFDILQGKKEVKRYLMPYPPLVMFNFRANTNEGFRICDQVISGKMDIYDLSERLQRSLINCDYLHASGLLGSWILPVENVDFYYDENGDINPWWGKSVIDIVKKHLNKSLLVFEWGCGNSTMFWSKNVKEVVSVENDKKWYDRMCKIVPSNVKINYCELEYGGEYCKTILREDRLFDIVLIDGRDRVRCAKNAVKRLKEDGILIWDNSDRKYYEEGDIFLQKQGFKKLEISSLVYGLPGVEDFTAIYYRNENIFGL